MSFRFLLKGKKLNAVLEEVVRDEKKRQMARWDDGIHVWHQVSRGWKEVK